MSTPDRSRMRPAFTQDIDGSMDLLHDPHLGSFYTDAVRPERYIVIEEAYKIVLRKDGAKQKVPTLVAAVSKGKIQRLFQRMIARMPARVDLIVEASHGLQSHSDWRELEREDLDRDVVMEWVQEFHDLLMNDGCLAVAIVDPDTSCELYLDTHKQLVAYGDIERMEEELMQERIPRKKMKDLTTVENVMHVHFTSDEFEDELQRFRYRTGIEDWTEAEEKFGGEDDDGDLQAP